MSGLLVHTIGHSKRSSAEFVELLHENGIELLVDIRRYPVSRRHPHFDGAALAHALAQNGIRTRHLEALGGHREAERPSRNLGLPDGAMRGYADHTASEVFRSAVERVLHDARSTRLVLMCAEARPEECHRRILADWLVAHGHAVVHVLGRDEKREHALDPCVTRDERGHVVWRARQAELFD